MDAFNILVEQAAEMAAGFVEMLPQIAIALFVLLLTWGASVLVQSSARGITSRAGLRHRVRELVARISGVLVWACGSLIALAVVLPGVESGGFLAAAGLVSIAVAYIFHDIFENFMAGVMIMSRKKMRIGDLIQFGDMEARVEQITARETYLRELSNELVIVPNTLLFNDAVEIVTDAGRRRHEITVRVERGTNLEMTRDTIERAVTSIEQVDSTRPVEVFACDLSDGSIEFTVRWWAGSQQIDMHRSRDAVIRALKVAFAHAGIVIPFPQISLGSRRASELLAVTHGLKLSRLS